MIGSMALVAGVVLWFLTLVGGAALFGMGAVVPLFVLVFPLFFWAVLVAGPGAISAPERPSSRLAPGQGAGASSDSPSSTFQRERWSQSLCFSSGRGSR